MSAKLSCFPGRRLRALLAVVCGIATAHQAMAAQIFSDANDGFLEVRDNLPPQNPWPVVHPDTFGDFDAQIGEWFGPGLTSVVIPFQLPNRGAVVDPFLSADLGIMVYNIGNDTVTDIDLYGVRVDPDPAISVDDFYVGAAFDPSATLIQESFLTPSSSAGFVGMPNNNTDATGDANLRDFLNTSYDGGAGAGQYVFLRLSYGADAFATGFDAYQMTVREAGLQGEWPVITFTVVPEPTGGVLLAACGCLAAAVRRRVR